MKNTNGFTLIELIITILLVGIIGSTVAIFSKGPVDAYYQTQKRSDLSQTLQVALNKIKRDIRQSLPNSVRSSNDTIEFIPVISASRYRIDTGGFEKTENCSLVNDPNFSEIDGKSILSIGFSDDCFETIGANDNLKKICPAGTCNFNDSLWVTIFNMGAGYSKADAYENFFSNISNTNSNIAKVTYIKQLNSGAPSKTYSYFVKLSTPNKFTYDSPNRKVFFVNKPVSYRCELVGSNYNLYKYTDYSVNESSLTTNFSTGIKSLALDNLSVCEFSYNPNALTGKFGIVSLKIEKNNESGKLGVLMEAIVSNVP